MTTYDEALKAAADDTTARHNAANSLARAYSRLRAEVEPSGWVLQDIKAPPAADHFLVGFKLKRGETVAQCTFKVGPRRQIAFDRAGYPVFSATLDDLGDAEIYQLLETWAGEVQAGVQL